MALDLTGMPLVDRPDFEDLLASGQFGPWSLEAERMHRDGFCVIDMGSPEMDRLCASIIKQLSLRLAPEIAQWCQQQAGPPRLQDGWKDVPEIKTLALLPAVADLLKHLYGREAFAFQSLNFVVGSQQSTHSDAVHFHSYPNGFMCGVWIALEDVSADSGPLAYYPGSHRFPYLSARLLGLSPDQLRNEEHPQVLFESTWQQQIAHAGLHQESFLPRRGQVLIWHANLLHGGQPVTNPLATRWSQVVHYYFDQCLYTTPMFSFAADQGGDDLRNPYRIENGRRRYTTEEWQAMGLTAPGAFRQASRPVERLRHA